VSLSEPATALCVFDAAVHPPSAAAGDDGHGTLLVAPWSDPVIDTLGHDPRSTYVEQFWLPILGPTATWLLRRMAAGFDTAPEGFELDLADTARALGLGARGGRHSPFQRALGRCISFRLARREGQGALGVRRRIPPLTRRHLDRLPPSLGKLHGEWSVVCDRTGSVDDARNRARRLALRLLDVGIDRSAVEIQLLRWHVHPSVAYDATTWALALPSTLEAP